MRPTLTARATLAIATVALGTSAPVPAHAGGIEAVGREHAFDTAIAAAIADTHHIYPVPADLVRAVMRQESGFRPTARSRAGAVGLMQVMPFNARALGIEVEDLQDPTKNVLAGVRMLAVLLAHYRGDVISALVAYNARPRKRGAPLPRNGETPGYVKAVLSYWRRYAWQGGRDLPQAAGEAPVTRERAADALPLRSSRRID